MPSGPERGYLVPDDELRVWIERLCDELCLTVHGNFDHLVRLGVTDDSLEKLLMLINCSLDHARRAAEARREAELMAREQATLLKEVGRMRQMGNYCLEELLGRGGMGEVWRGAHRMLARPAAIKLIQRDRIADGDSRAADLILARFQREARATAALRSPHTIGVYDFGVHEGDFYYVMELLDGVDLETLVKRQGPQPPERIAYLLRQACHSLHEAHRSGMIHRDVKPSNLFVCRYGLDLDFLKVLDFGLVRVSAQDAGDGRGTNLTQEHGISGTPAFLAPEQILGEPPVDARADLYSLGCTAYWLLTGRLVFEASNAMAVMIRHVKDTPVPPSHVANREIPAALEALVMQCLEKDREKRPAGARALGEALDASGLAAAWTEDRRAAWWKDWTPPKLGDLPPPTLGETRPPTL